MIIVYHALILKVGANFLNSMRIYNFIFSTSVGRGQQTKEPNYYTCCITHRRWIMVFHWHPSDNKSSLIFRAPLCISADVINSFRWSRLAPQFPTLLGTVPRAPIIIGVTFTLIFHIFFSSLARSKYLSTFPHYYYYYVSFLSFESD